MKNTNRITHTLIAAALAALTVGISSHAARAQKNSPMSTSSVEQPPITPTSYVLAPFDTLDIIVQGHEDMHLAAQVLTDGTFKYPIIGTIKASGMTVDQLTQFITKGLSDYFNQPQVTVSVKESHIQKISVAGIAHTSGVYDYRPGLTVLEIVSQAGGSNQANELTDLTLVTKRNGQTVAMPISLVALLNGDATQNMPLSPGDTLLFAPRDPAKAEVQIVGQIVKAGQYPVMKDGATLISLISEAGGTTPYAALSQVQVTHNGKTTVYDLHPTLFNIDDPSGKVAVYAGDTINIPLNNNKIAVQGEVRAPSIYAIPDGEPMTVFTALSLAGGPTIEGNKKLVAIMRLGKDNQRHFIEVNLDNIYKGKTTKGMQIADLPLQDKDILIVPTRNHGHNIADILQAVPGYYYISQILGVTHR